MLLFLGTHESNKDEINGKDFFSSMTPSLVSKSSHGSTYLGHKATLSHVVPAEKDSHRLLPASVALFVVFALTRLLVPPYFLPS